MRLLVHRDADRRCSSLGLLGGSSPVARRPWSARKRWNSAPSSSGVGISLPSRVSPYAGAGSSRSSSSRTIDCTCSSLPVWKSIAACVSSARSRSGSESQARARPTVRQARGARGRGGILDSGDVVRRVGGQADCGAVLLAEADLEQVADARRNEHFRCPEGLCTEQLGRPPVRGDRDRACVRRCPGDRCGSRPSAGRRAASTTMSAAAMNRSHLDVGLVWAREQQERAAVRIAEQLHVERRRLVALPAVRVEEEHRPPRAMIEQFVDLETDDELGDSNDSSRCSRASLTAWSSSHRRTRRAPRSSPLLRPAPAWRGTRSALPARASSPTVPEPLAAARVEVPGPGPRSYGPSPGAAGREVSATMFRCASV